MERTRTKKPENGRGGTATTFADVFGGPPKYSAATGAAAGGGSEDFYGEIFGGLSTTCSIPFLDIPPAPAVSDIAAAVGGVIDYDEIFGGFSADIGVSYEELVGIGRVDKEQEQAVSKQENSKDPEVFREQNAREATPSGAAMEHPVSSNKQHFCLNSEALINGPLENSISYKIGGGTPQADSTGYTFLVDSSCNLLSEDAESSLNMAANDLGEKAGFVKGNSDVKQEDLVKETSSFPSSRSSVDELNDKTFVPEDAPAIKSYSRSSSYHSTSSGDVSYRNTSYVTISDINLRTHPKQVPPPSRPPPGLVKMQASATGMHTNSEIQLDEGILFRSMKMSHNKHRREGVRKVRLLTENAKKDSSSFHDVEMDAASAAAASAAAMIEAMEQAQARLKSAKELMERKRENAQRQKKLGHSDSSTSKDNNSSEVNPAENGTSGKLVWEPMALGASGMEAETVSEPVYQNSKEPKGSEADYKFNEKIRLKDVKLSHTLNLGTGEWKEDESFYELINNEKSKIVEEVPEQLTERKPEELMKSNIVGECETKGTKRNRKLWKINNAHECEVKNEILRAGSMIAQQEEPKEIPGSIPVAYVQKECSGGLNANHIYLAQEKSMEKLEAAQEKHLVSDKEAERSLDGNYSVTGESIKELPNESGDQKHHNERETKEKERKPEASSIFCRTGVCETVLAATDNDEVTVDNKREPTAAHLISEHQQGEKNLTLQQNLATVDAVKVVIEEHSGTGSAKNDKTGHAAFQYDFMRATEGPVDIDCCSNEVASSFLLKLGGSSDLGGMQSASISVEDMTKLEVELEALISNESANEDGKLDVNQGGSEEEAVEAVKEALEADCTEAASVENLLKLEQEEKIQDLNQPVHNQESFESVTKEEHETGEHTQAIEIQATNRLDESRNTVDATEEFCPRNVDIRSHRKFIFPENGGDDSVSATGDRESSSSGVPGKTIPDVQKREEKERDHGLEGEKEEEKEQVQKLEEEREREREREKDRLRVERATREVHGRVLAETRERAERLAVERITTEARQRALAEAKGKAERAAAEVLEKSRAEKASREARLKAERAAVERATAEARERAVERARADARERAERLNSISKDRTRKDYESEDSRRSEQYQNGDSSSSLQRHSTSNGAQTESALRRKARLERHQRTVERAAKALAEKNMRDILAQREQAERNRLAESLDAVIKRWSSGKEGNLRALLSTLQYILGHDSGWQPTPLTEIITAAAVKKAYRKATLCVHPDKLQQRGASIQQKYICEKVFDLLKEAWNKFNSEER